MQELCFCDTQVGVYFKNTNLSITETHSSPTAKRLLIYNSIDNTSKPVPQMY